MCDPKDGCGVDGSTAARRRRHPVENFQIREQGTKRGPQGKPLQFADRRDEIPDVVRRRQAEGLRLTKGGRQSGFNETADDLLRRLELVRHSPACSPTTALPSAWTAKAPGGTTSSSSGYGAAASARRSIGGPRKASGRSQIRSAGIPNSTIDASRIRSLTKS